MQHRDAGRSGYLHDCVQRAGREHSSLCRRTFDLSGGELGEEDGGDMKFLENPPRFLFFTGKGGVGKTSVACAAAVHLATLGRRVLLVSTDPASNLGQVFGIPIGNHVMGITGVRGLAAMEIDPGQAADAYRERVIAPMAWQGVRSGDRRDHGRPLRLVHDGDRVLRRVHSAPHGRIRVRAIRPRHLRYRSHRPHHPTPAVAGGVDRVPLDRRRCVVPRPTRRTRQAPCDIRGRGESAHRPDPHQARLGRTSSALRLKEIERTFSDLTAIG